MAVSCRHEEKKCRVGDDVQQSFVPLAYRQVGQVTSADLKTDEDL